MPEIVVQVELGGMQIAFTELVKGDEKSINEYLDKATKAVGRQRAKQQLTEKLIDQLTAEKRLKAIPEEKQALALARAEERTRMRSGWEQSHWASGRRAEYKESDSQKKGLEQFDAATAQQLETLDKEKAGHEMTLQLLEVQIPRIRAVIDGGEPAAPLEEEAAGFAEAAE